MSDSPRYKEEDKKSPVHSPRYESIDDRRGRSRSSDRGNRRGRSPEDRGLTAPHRDEANKSCIYIAKLSRGARESDIREAFSRYGVIRSLVLKSSYAFLTYETPEAATEAISRMNGAKFINGEESIVVEQSGTEH
jgi:RNA recognition motif-containing protein